HPTGEGTPAFTAALLRRAGRRPGLVAPARQPPAGDGKHHAGEHDDEAKDAEDREASDHCGLEGHAGYQHPQTDHEERRALQTPPRGGRAEPAAAYARRELGILGVESALDLVEHPLLMIGEWHSSLLADSLSRNYR